MWLYAGVRNGKMAKYGTYLHWRPSLHLPANTRPCRSMTVVLTTATVDRPWAASPSNLMDYWLPSQRVHECLYGHAFVVFDNFFGFVPLKRSRPAISDGRRVRCPGEEIVVQPSCDDRTVHELGRRTRDGLEWKRVQVVGTATQHVISIGQAVFLSDAAQVFTVTYLCCWTKICSTRMSATGARTSRLDTVSSNSVERSSYCFKLILLRH